ncbi:MAG: baseplate J/gp47 family protein [bacterium]
MAEKDIIRNMIFRPGQSQEDRDRASRELIADFAMVDERTPGELLLFIKQLAALVNHYRHYPLQTPETPGDWTSFFPYDKATVKQYLENKSGKVSPHLALILAFLELYEKPQELINGFTGRHLNYYYRDVLRLSKKKAVADRAYVLLELKKNMSPVSIGPSHAFSAGKDNQGVELLYAPTGTTIINSAKVDSLRSVYLDGRGRGAVRYAPVANSSDGTGGPLDSDQPKWYGFGHEALPLAEVGFALSSPVLRMKEGTRTVTVTLTVNHADSIKVDSEALNKAFEAFITGEKKWLGPFDLSLRIQRDKLEFAFDIKESEPAVTDYNAAVHGYAYAAQTPVLQVLLKSGSSQTGYNDFKSVTVQAAAVKVGVSNVTSLSLESDGGTLDPKKAFLPFGPQPTKGSRLIVGYAEALAKKLTAVNIKVYWKNAPTSFSSYYSGYGESSINNSYFTAAVSFKDGGNWDYASSGMKLFDSGDASNEHLFTFENKKDILPASRLSAEGLNIHALTVAGSLWASQTATKYIRQRPVLTPYRKVTPEPQGGFITFTLEKDFLHSTYRIKYVENILNYTKENGTLPPLNEPYTPSIQSISLSYEAYSDNVDIASPDLMAFSNEDVQFYHIAYFGQMREHGYQRQQFDFVADKSIPLLPLYTNEGELLIGLKELKPNDSVSILFQVAEGSAAPDQQEDIHWSVLCDNYWNPLGKNEIGLDTTNQLLTSGIITFVIPSGATTNNTILPGGMVWIKGVMAGNVTALCQLIEVSANAVEVQFTEHDNDPSHLLTALEKNRISKLKNGLPPIKSVKQPYASFGGAPEETDDAFATRVSERLRHKDRCITAWDYERIVLEAFPRIHKVKCIPHAREGAWLAPGNILLVVVPDLKNKNAAAPLEPKVDADTISRITKYVQKRAGMQISVKVKNPDYQKVRLDFKVKFREGLEFNYYSNQLEKELIRFLSPWAYGGDRDISFGGKVYKSVLLDFVGDLDYIDYVKDFKMYSYTAGVSTSVDRNEVQLETPDAILVSDDTHTIHEVD